MPAKDDDPKEVLKEINKLLKEVEADDHDKEVKAIDKALKAVVALKKDTTAVEEA